MNTADVQCKLTSIRFKANSDLLKAAIFLLHRNQRDIINKFTFDAVVSGFQILDPNLPCHISVVCEPAWTHFVG